MSMSVEMLVEQYIGDGYGYHELKKLIREKWSEDCQSKAKKYLKKCRAKGMFKNDKSVL